MMTSSDEAEQTKPEDEGVTGAAADSSEATDKDSADAPDAATDQSAADI